MEVGHAIYIVACQCACWEGTVFQRVMEVWKTASLRILPDAFFPLAGSDLYPFAIIKLISVSHPSIELKLE